MTVAARLFEIRDSASLLLSDVYIVLKRDGSPAPGPLLPLIFVANGGLWLVDAVLRGDGANCRGVKVGNYVVYQRFHSESARPSPLAFFHSPLCARAKHSMATKARGSFCASLVHPRWTSGHQDPDVTPFLVPCGTYTSVLSKCSLQVFPDKAQVATLVHRAVSRFRALAEILQTVGNNLSMKSCCYAQQIDSTQ